MLPFSRLENTVSRRPKGYTEQPKTIGEHLLKYRIDRKQKRIEVAKSIGVAPSVITDWEKGRYQPYATNYKKIVDFMGCNPLKDS
jgi:predicted transcriptional regulator